MKKRQPRPYDSDLDNVLHATNHLSPAEISSRSGNLVAPSTIRNRRNRKVRSPLNYTLTAALKAAGYERIIRKIKGK